jgi:hypothetical protein
MILPNFPMYRKIRENHVFMSNLDQDGKIP